MKFDSNRIYIALIFATLWTLSANFIEIEQLLYKYKILILKKLSLSVTDITLAPINKNGRKGRFSSLGETESKY